MSGDEDESKGGDAITVALRELPEALDRAVYVHNRWPLVVDPSGQAARFLKYQRGGFLSTSIVGDMVDTNLRRCLVGALRYASFLTINFGDDASQDISKYFSDGHFPSEVLSRTELYKDEVWRPLLRPEEGDPSPATFLPRDEFKFIIVTQCDPPPAHAASRMMVVRVAAPEDRKETEDEVMAAAYGLKLVKRNSKEMVELAFDGELEQVQAWLEKGYDIESMDGHKHTAMSEAACQGHNDIVRFLLSAGANPNAVNDQGRSPLYRAAFNGHATTVELLLRSGADLKLKDKSLQGPFDVTQDDACRTLLSEWDYSVTERLLAERAEAIRIQQEERLRTAAERDAAARIALRDEAVEKATAGDAAGLVELLQRAADEASNEAGGRPRVKADVRDARGNTLLAIAAWHGHLDLVKMLLTKYTEFHKTLEEVEYKTFKTNVNARDSKGWTPVSIAAFHDHANIVRELLAHGGNPNLPNLYHKTAWDNAKGKPEVLAVLQEWEREHVAVPTHQGTDGGNGDEGEGKGKGNSDEGAVSKTKTKTKANPKAKAKGKAKGTKAKAAKTTKTTNTTKTKTGRTRVTRTAKSGGTKTQGTATGGTRTGGTRKATSTTRTGTRRTAASAATARTAGTVGGRRGRTTASRSTATATAAGTAATRGRRRVPKK